MARWTYLAVTPTTKRLVILVHQLSAVQCLPAFHASQASLVPRLADGLDLLCEVHRFAASRALGCTSPPLPAGHRWNERDRGMAAERSAVPCAGHGGGERHGDGPWRRRPCMAVQGRGNRSRTSCTVRPIPADIHILHGERSGARGSLAASLGRGCHLRSIELLHKVVQCLNGSRHALSGADCPVRPKQRRQRLA